MRVHSRQKSQARTLANRARKAFGALPGRMEEIAGNAALRLRERDTYQDHTGDLRRSTEVLLSLEGNGDAVIELVMDMPYASFVKRLGFSGFDEEALRASQRIKALVARLPDQINL